ncbi:MAG: IclR family transcriptional regulator [Gammaproteobacteria bacterium]|nr:IclR family transcriptional regulator [Gammaproteobacteria bacterium]
MLEALASTRPAPRVIDELAARVGLTRSNAHRTLRTLMHAGYVHREPAGGRYAITTKALALGLADMDMSSLQQIAPGFMATLAHGSRETVHLSVLDGLEVVYLEKIESSQPVRAYSEIGGRAPAHAVATGKALLAAQPANALDALPATLPRCTAATLVTRDALRAELASVARAGHAVNCGEWRDGVGGLAAVIRGVDGTAVAALGISGPLDRLTPQRLRELAPVVMDLAARMSATLGWLEKLKPDAVASRYPDMPR